MQKSSYETQLSQSDQHYSKEAYPMTVRAGLKYLAARINTIMGLYLPFTFIVPYTHTEGSGAITSEKHFFEVTTAL